ncbi:MAG TPA: rRNA maturation RNase YbeY [Candidatus Limnocylindrales bacterium]|jgi:probable rRNA maturation factor|nr:rRNA maturation RNase YbeY [Candidatus Limnocylindrales bacterium]
MRSISLPPWRIDIDRRPGAPRLIPDASVARAVSAALTAAGAPPPASVGIRLTDDGDLAALNAEHMGETGPTDVLSFPILPPEAFPPHPGRTTGPGTASFPLPPGARQPLGDVVVSVERAIAQAEQGRGGQTGDVRWSAADELRLLVTHGVLHLCGWDHATPAEETAMRALEQRLLATR